MLGGCSTKLGKIAEQTQDSGELALAKLKVISPFEPTTNLLKLLPK